MKLQKGHFGQQNRSTQQWCQGQKMFMVYSHSEIRPPSAKATSSLSTVHCNFTLALHLIVNLLFRKTQSRTIRINNNSIRSINKKTSKGPLGSLLLGLNHYKIAAHNFTMLGYSNPIKLYLLWTFATKKIS